MRTGLMIAAVIAGLAGQVQAQAEPMSGNFVGQKDGDLLRYSCGSPSNEKITCQFTQVMLRKNTLDVSEALSEIPDNLSEHPETKEALQQCSEFIPALDAFLQSGEVPVDLLPPDYEAEKLIDLVKQDPAGTTEIAKGLRVLCELPTKSSLERLFSTLAEQEKVSCTSSFNSYEQVFVKVTDELWVAQSSPEGTCGVINTSRFTRTGETYQMWNYTSSKVVTNKSGELFFGMNCADLDESDQPYVWNANPKRVDCTFMK